jgi:CRP/FNR family transcriptional regulator, cyclic AMP receptor protein
MAHWMCTRCGYYVRDAAPPERCPSCHWVCAFNDVTCYRPECGGEQNIDLLLVGSTLRVLKGGPGPDQTIAAAALKAASPFDLLQRESPNDKETLEQLRFWVASQIDLLRGLNKEQRGRITSLGVPERYEADAVIFSEGEKAKNLYLVEDGRLVVESQVARGMRFPISIIYPGQGFGWSALVPPHTYTASVTAMATTRVTRIDKDLLFEFLEREPSLGFVIMQNVACIVASRMRAVELAVVGLLQNARGGIEGR